MEMTPLSTTRAITTPTTKAGMDAMYAVRIELLKARRERDRLESLWDRGQIKSTRDHWNIQNIWSLVERLEETLYSMEVK